VPDRDEPRLPDGYAEALAGLGAATLTALQAVEAALRRLHPPLLPRLREQLRPVEERLSAEIEGLRGTETPAELGPFTEQLARGAALCLEALGALRRDEPMPRAAAHVLAGMRSHCRAQETLYPLRAALPPLGRYFVEAPFHDRLAELDPATADPQRVGVHRAGTDEQRGGFHLYVPESLDLSQPRPLVIALHGGSGLGRDFVWTWLREARGRRFLLLAPDSRGPTWSLDAPDRDISALREMLDFVAERWPVDRSSVLLTGLSDGATFTLLAGLAEGAPYTALAPVSGVLHPANFQNGNLSRARKRRIRLVHGALDWMFPVAVARMAREALAEAGADLVYREIGDLSHTYPREENAHILTWFDPRLALPPATR
jgi:phospholipase/carboxylesterase